MLLELPHGNLVVVEVRAGPRYGHCWRDDQRRGVLWDRRRIERATGYRIVVSSPPLQGQERSSPHHRTELQKASPGSFGRDALYPCTRRTNVRTNGGSNQTCQDETVCIAMHH